ncbi:RidA family protein [Acanthopleuribacter pedis]|uniref:RidA family protein n=2 Tax=Acanthopleuribacter pedis TaxID=442870 RepID=A0A8J7U6K3_9BACT|nr:RidA family protein [Acanthopleuribacter pedis]MBO1322862.1 RidA family protein [Acanthopleuribacter pedis]
MSEAIHTDQAPAAIGPYVQARKVNLTGQLLFTSGQIALDPATGQLVGEGDVAAQTRLCLANLGAILKEAGASPAHVIKTTVFIKDMNDFGAINEIYADFFGNHKPARSCVEVARLPKDVLVEIEAIAQI